MYLPEDTFSRVLVGISIALLGFLCRSVYDWTKQAKFDSLEVLLNRKISGPIEKLHGRVSSVKDDVSGLKTDNAVIKSEICGLKEEFAKMKIDVASMSRARIHNGGFDKLEADVKAIKDAVNSGRL